MVDKKRQAKFAGGEETVLLVDDEPMVLEVGQQMLTHLGYTVMGALSSRNALELFRENREQIDLVVMDMIMPEMSGAELYDKLLEEKPGVKVLLSSGYSLDGQASEILDRGCNGFIQKPFHMNELALKIRNILDETF